MKPVLNLSCFFQIEKAKKSKKQKKEKKSKKKKKRSKSDSESDDADLDQVNRFKIGRFEKCEKIVSLLKVVLNTNQSLY